ncbi:MAG: hypothetical protein J7L08_02470 [Candidatus Aenigmarchaeota archaeon]|nr:hypothetical protein [Candidatus Aenigmarchaeota archaeon]
MNTLNETMNMGFCPTMEVFMEDILKINNEIKANPMGSAAQVLTFLREGYINIGFIGRLAKKIELNDRIKEKRLWKGYTLVGQFKMGIPVEELPYQKITTYLPKEKVEKFIPEVKRIVYYDNKEDAIADGIYSSVLIDWDDYQDDYELVIPVHRNGLKVLKFRTPTIFYYEQFEDEIEELSKKIKDAIRSAYEI